MVQFILLALAMATIAIDSLSEARIIINTIHVEDPPTLEAILHARPPNTKSNKLTFTSSAWDPTPSNDYSYYKQCLKKVSGLCGKEMYNSIFIGHETRIVGLECCGQMVSMGLQCHEKLVGATLSLPENEGKDKDEIKQRDAKVWDRCVRVTNLLNSVFHQALD